MDRKLVIGTTAVVGVLVVGGIAASMHSKGSGDGVAKVEVMEVQSGSSSDSVVAEGNIIPNQSAVVSVMPDMIGQVSAVNVDVGDHVTKGEVLAVLDPDTAVYDAQQASNNVQSAQAKLSLLKNPHWPEELAEKRLALLSDQNNIDAANQKLQLLLAGARPQEIQAAQAAVSSAQTRLTLDSTNANRLQVLYSKDLAPKADYDTATAQVAMDQDGLTQAQLQLSLLNSGARPQEIKIAQADLQGAKFTYQSDQEALKLLLKGSRQEDIQQAQVDVNNSSLAASQKEQILQRKYVLAPISGIITGRYMNVGEIAMPAPVRTSEGSLFRNNARGLFTIADDSKMMFLANVDQQYYTSMHVGSTVAVNIESLPGKTFTGTIKKYAPIINPDLGRKGSSVAINPAAPFTFNVWVNLGNDDHQLLPGQLGQMTLNSQQAGLAVPQAAVTPFSLGTGMVYVEKDGVITPKQVRYDSNMNGSLRILSGLVAGEHVVVSPMKVRYNGMKVQPELVDSSYLSSASA